MNYEPPEPISVLCHICKQESADCLMDMETREWTCPRCDGRIPPVVQVPGQVLEGAPAKVEWFTMPDSAGKIRVIDLKTKKEYEAMNRKARRKFEMGRLKNFPVLPQQLGTAHATRKKRTGSGTDEDS